MPPRLPRMLKRAGFRASADMRNEKLGFKVREAELAKVPYMVVVGEREAAARRFRSGSCAARKAQVMALEDLLELLKAEPSAGVKQIVAAGKAKRSAGIADGGRNCQFTGKSAGTPREVVYS